MTTLAPSPPVASPPGHRTAERAAGLLRRYRWPVVGIWLLLLVVAAVVGRPLPDLLSGGGWYVGGSQSQLAAQAVSEGFLAPGATTVTLVVQDERFTADAPEFAQRVEGVAQDVAADPELEVAGFSLSTDYEIFLLSRVREEWVRTGDGTASVARGVAQTGPLISGAAALMVAVFGAFALASVLPIQQLGLGLAVAIALDATIIRLFVVPASMRLLGDWNWWLPSLRRGSSNPSTAAPAAQVPAPRRGGTGSAPAEPAAHPRAEASAVHSHRPTTTSDETGSAS